MLIISLPFRADNTHLWCAARRGSALECKCCYLVNTGNRKSPGFTGVQSNRMGKIRNHRPFIAVSLDFRSILKPAIVVRIYIEMTQRLFVYGTLGPGRPNEHVLSAIGGTWEEASVNGFLMPRGWGAEMGYPGIVLDDTGE